MSSIQRKLATMNATPLTSGILFLSIAMIASAGATAAEVRFNRDVLPILSAKCFACHGVDKARRTADLRLDVREVALADRDGVPAIVPGRPEQSELIRRISSSDPDERMPPQDEGEPLGDHERHVLTEWITDGAVYEGHWAFQPPADAGSSPRQERSPTVRR